MPRTADPLAKARLLRAARQEFAASSLQRTRVEDITRRAGLAKGSFYLHFTSKDDVFSAIIDGFFAEIAGFSQECSPSFECAKTAHDALAALQAHDEQLLEFMWNHRDLIKMMHTSSGAQKRYADVLHAFLDMQTQQVVVAVRELQQRGFYDRDVDPEICALVIVGGWFNLARRMTQLASKPDLRVWAKSFRRLVWLGLSIG